MPLTLQVIEEGLRYYKPNRPDSLNSAEPVIATIREKYDTLRKEYSLDTPLPDEIASQFLTWFSDPKMESPEEFLSKLRESLANSPSLEACFVTIPEILPTALEINSSPISDAINLPPLTNSVLSSNGIRDPKLMQLFFIHQVNDHKLQRYNTLSEEGGKLLDSISAPDDRLRIFLSYCLIQENGLCPNESDKTILEELITRGEYFFMVESLLRNEIQQAVCAQESVSHMPGSSLENPEIPDENLSLVEVVLQINHQQAEVYYGRLFQQHSNELSEAHKPTAAPARASSFF